MTKEKIKKEKATTQKKADKEKVIEPEVVQEITKDERQIALLCHILATVGGFLVPLIIYLIKKDESEFIEDQAKESLNFQITFMIASFVAVSFVILTYFFTCGFSIIIMFPLGVVDIVFCIIAGLKANEGEKYRYPFCIRLVK